MTEVTLVNPNVVSLRKDPFTTGIVFLPLALSYFAAALRKKGVSIEIVDSFGEAPNAYRVRKKFVFRGLSPEELEKRIPESRIIVVYAINTVSHESTIEIIRHIKAMRPDTLIAVLENTQSVLGYSLTALSDAFFESGADILLTGEPEVHAVQCVMDRLRREPENGIIPGVLFKGQAIEGFKKNEAPLEGEALDALAFPAWDLFPLKNYWDLGYGHSTFQGPYLSILTSRGCPYRCGFCVSPALNQSQWRPRSAANVVDEIEYFKKTLGVREFHVEDLHPGIDEDRLRAIALEITARKVDIIWQISAGTKIEILKLDDTFDILRRSGFCWVGFCPESGSKKIRGLIGKEFDEERALKQIRHMGELGIHCQSCFILGYPEEIEEDRNESLRLMEQMVDAGLDEIAIFIVTPIPGSALYRKYAGYESTSELNFTPAWRSDFAVLEKFRKKMYFRFFLRKFTRRPHTLLIHAYRFLTRRFALRMEMTPYRGFQTIARVFWEDVKSRARGLLGLPARWAKGLRRLVKGVRIFLKIAYCKFTGKNIPIVVYITVNNACNLKCDYCYAEVYKRDVKEFSTGQLLDLIDELKEKGTEVVILLGGEPTLRKDIGVIIDRLRARGMYSEMVSNGYYVGKKIEELKGLDSLCLSIDSIKEGNDVNRGEGAFEKALDAIRVARENGINIRTHSVLTKSSIKHLDAFVEMGRKMDMVMTFAQANKISGVDEVEVSDEALNEAMDRLLEYQRRGYPVRISKAAMDYSRRWPFSHHYYPRKAEMAAAKEKGVVQCRRKFLASCIDADGKVYACPGKWGKVKNSDSEPVRKYGKSFLEVGFTEAWKDLENFDCEACGSLGEAEFNLLFDLHYSVLLNVAEYYLRTLLGKAGKGPK